MRFGPKHLFLDGMDLFTWLDLELSIVMYFLNSVIIRKKRNKRTLFHIVFYDVISTSSWYLPGCTCALMAVCVFFRLPAVLMTSNVEFVQA